MKKFKPMLAPNETILAQDITVSEYYKSLKLDGIRCIFIGGEMVSRSLKPIPNKQLHKRFELLKNYSKSTGWILDGEIYDHDISFQDIQSYTRTEDFESEKSVKKYKEVRQIPESLKFHVFDTVPQVGQLHAFDMPFWKRLEYADNVASLYPHIVEMVDQVKCIDPEQVTTKFQDALQLGYEGLMLKNANGAYKCGRGTIKEGLIYKFKPYETFDAKIIDVIQQTEAREGSEKTINELGNSVTSKKLEDRVPVDMASAFLVKYEDQELKVALSSMDHDSRATTWYHRKELIGKCIEYKGMNVGAKDVPRHPVFIRFRPDKD